MPSSTGGRLHNVLSSGLETENGRCLEVASPKDRPKVYSNNQITETTVFVYDASSRLVAEYSTILNETPQVAYLTNDHLGSPRINTNENGAVISRHDYRPYGEEITERTHSQYVGDTIRKQFTGYERDGETDLDFAQARMYTTNTGRFTAPDPLLSSGRPTNPESWNRYVYTLNNPIRMVDPLGLYEFDAGVDDNQRQNFRNQLKVAEKRVGRIKKIYGANSEEYQLAKKGFEAYGCTVGKGCKEDATGAGRVIIKVGKLDPGVGAQDERDDANNRAIVTVSGAVLSNANADLADELVHEGVHAQDDINYLDSGKKTTVTDYEAERSAYVATSAMEEVRPSSSASKWMNNAGSFPTWDENWKTANPKLKPNENVRNERKVAIDKLLAVPKAKGGLYETTPTNPGHSYYP